MPSQTNSAPWQVAPVSATDRVAAAALDAMSPLKVLERGYAIAHNAQGQVVRDASTMTAGDELRLRLWKGSLDCRVEGTNVE